MTRFVVEQWAPGYGASVADDGLDRAKEPVDPSVEVPVDRWEPRWPDAPGGGPAVVAFVDGVRRIDCRVWFTDGPHPRPGLCASVAAGAVLCQPGSARVTTVEGERGLHTTADGVDDLKVPGVGTYEVHRLEGDDDDETLSGGVGRHMTELELRVSRTLEGAGLVVFDGPLRGRREVTGVGYVKTQHVEYLEPGLLPVVFALEAGQRTPLFAVGGQFPRWSWYLRLPGPRAHGLTGVVRLELPGLGDAAGAAERADEVSACLPRFASQAHKEARAPQNLYPIAGLEHHLRHRLGDPFLLERHLRLAAHSAA